MIAALVLGWLALAPAGAGFTVAVDPGHGGKNCGGEGLRKGLYEKHVTLEIARRVRRNLLAERGLRVVLCREADVLVPINARVRCGNEAGARLFVSIHTNASPFGPSRGMQRGFEIYVLPVQGVDHDAGLAAIAPASPVDGAWAAHQVRATAVESLAAAQRIEWQMADALGSDRDRGIKQAGAKLDVLQGLKMPAVLVEVGFLDHPQDGNFLATEAGWDKIAGALSRAISDLRARELRGRTDPTITARTAPAR